jgi:hypothetical protein
MALRCNDDARYNRAVHPCLPTKKGTLLPERLLERAALAAHLCLDERAQQRLRQTADKPLAITGGL